MQQQAQALGLHTLQAGGWLRSTFCLPAAASEYELSSFPWQHVQRLLTGCASSCCTVTWRWDFLSNELRANACVRRYIAVCLLFWCVCLLQPWHKPSHGCPLTSQTHTPSSLWCVDSHITHKASSCCYYAVRHLEPCLCFNQAANMLTQWFLFCVFASSVLITCPFTSKHQAQHAGTVLLCFAVNSRHVSHAVLVRQASKLHVSVLNLQSVAVMLRICQIWLQSWC